MASSRTGVGGDRGGMSGRGTVAQGQGDGGGDPPPYGTITITTLNLRGASASSPEMDNKIRQLISRQDPHWHRGALLLLQEARAGKHKGIDPKAFGATAHFSACGGLGLLAGKGWSLRSVRAGSPALPRSFYEEYRLVHERGARWVVFNTHLPSPAHAAPDTCRELLLDIIPRIRRSFQSADATLVAGDFNEVLRPHHTSGAFRPPLVLPALMGTGLTNMSGDHHTYFQPGQPHSAKLDWILGALPPTAVAISHQVKTLVDSDHRACQLTCRILVGRPYASLPPPDKPRWPVRWACAGSLDRARGMVCLSGKLPHAVPSQCPLHHGCSHQVDLKAAGFTEGALEKIADKFQVRVISGSKHAFSLVDWGRAANWQEAHDLGRIALREDVLRRRLCPRPLQPSKVAKTLHDLSCLVRRCLKHRGQPVRLPRTLRPLFPDRNAQVMLDEAKAALKREARRLRRARIKVALASRRAQLEAELGVWHRRIKIHSPPLRTDAHWSNNTLSFAPGATRRHFAAMVGKTGTAVPGPARHPYSDLIPSLPADRAQALGRPFTTNEVAAVLAGARSSSAPGPSGITVRMLRDIPPDHIARWCNAALETGDLGKATCQAYVRLLNKTEEEFPPPGKFRPITLLETSYKLVSALLQRRVLRALRGHDAVPPTAYAFGVRTDITCPILHRAALIDHARCTGAPLIIVDFDASAAFNSPTHEAILDAWASLGAPANVRHLLRTMLTDVRVRVVTDCGLSRSFRVTRGAVQGDVLAPLHWLLTYAALQHLWERRATAMDIGIGEDSLKLRIIIYADDTAVYLREVDKVERLANLIAESLREIGVQVNPSKTVIQAMNTPPDFQTVVIQGTSVPVTVRNRVRYLGVFRNVGDPSDTFQHALLAVQQLANHYRIGAMTVAEAIRLIAAVAIPQLAYRLSLTATSHAELEEVERRLHAVIRTSKGFPVGVNAQQTRLILPSLCRRVHSFRLETLRRHLFSYAPGSIRCSLLAGLLAAMPRLRRVEKNLLTWLRHPRLSHCVAAPGTLLAAMLESMNQLDVYMDNHQTVTLTPTISELLLRPAPRAAAEECLRVLTPPAKLESHWWSFDGVTLRASAWTEFPILSGLVSVPAPSRRALRRPYSLATPPGCFAIQVCSTDPLSYYLYRVLRSDDQHHHVHYLHPHHEGGYREVTGRLPRAAASWVEHEGPDPRGPVGLVEHDALRPIAMRLAGGRWFPVLGNDDISSAYMPNLQHGIQQPRPPWKRTKPAPADAPDANVIYTDGSGQLDGIGWGVSARLDGKRIRMAGGWVDETHTAQEGELVAMLHALHMASRSRQRTRIYSDSQHIVESLNARRTGRFAPALMRCAVRLASSPHVKVEYTPAHQRSKARGPSNPDADILAKWGAQKAFTPLNPTQLPRSPRLRKATTWRRASNHAIVTRPLSARTRGGLQVAWIRITARTKLTVMLLLASFLRGHLPWQDRDSCAHCSGDDPTLAHRMTCRRRPVQSRRTLQTAWASIITKSGMPPGFWRLSPQPPWPSLDAHPHGWRDYVDGSGKRWCINDGSTKHEFRPPRGTLRVDPHALAIIIKLWPRLEPELVLCTIRPPAVVVPSPAMACMAAEPSSLARTFRRILATQCTERVSVVHPSWEWAFQLLRRRGRMVTLEPIPDEPLLRIAFARNPFLDFLTQPAQPTPDWDTAVQMGSEELTPLGYIGPHSSVYPVEVDDILALRSALCGPHTQPPR